MSQNERRQVRKPATKLAHLQKKLHQQKAQVQGHGKGRARKFRGKQP